MIRVSTFSQDGMELKFASLSVAEAEAFIEEGKVLLGRTDVKAEEWLTRRNATVLSSLNKPLGPMDLLKDGESWTESRLKTEFDLPTLDALYLAILKFSGLQPGEVTAVAGSSKSAAA